jgi:hypothetical protein
MYDREFKEVSLRDTLASYRRFLNIPAYGEDKRLVFFLTLCHMLDRVHATESASTAEEDAGQPRPPMIGPLNFRALEANQNRFFARYTFDPRLTEAENMRKYLDDLLDAPDDSTVRFI